MYFDVVPHKNFGEYNPNTPSSIMEKLFFLMKLNLRMFSVDLKEIV